jgi:trans-aconitate 2-methyltransferase
MTKDKEVKEYYDAYTRHQKRIGVNIRHRTIYRNLRKLGLNNRSNVLEVGCGIGTVSSLILKTVSDGSFVGVDISPESIRIACELKGRHRNAEFLVSDMTDFSHNSRFNFIVLPDVLEHIPVEQHNNIFRLLSQLAAGDARILINIPEPAVQDWHRAHQPEKLQIIDQSLDLGRLISDVCNNGFSVWSVTPYSLYSVRPDYVSLVFIRSAVPVQYSLKSWWRRGFENLISKFA